MLRASWKGSLRGGHGLVGIIDAGEWEVAEDAALVNRTAPRVMARAGAVLAIDVQGMSGAQGALTSASAASKCVCMSAGGLNMVA